MIIMRITTTRIMMKSIRHQGAIMRMKSSRQLLRMILRSKVKKDEDDEDKKEPEEYPEQAPGAENQISADKVGAEAEEAEAVQKKHVIRML